MKHYYFKNIIKCEMCDDLTTNHKLLGQRLNKSQGVNPRNKSGITVSIFECTNCNLIYSNPQPIPFDLQDHYGTPPEDYWKEEYFVFNESYFLYQTNLAKKLLDNKSNLKSLDIGAGLGKAMKTMENNGFDAYGFEPSVPFYERAISKMNMSPEKFKLGALEEMNYENESFDFITFGAVFEHIYEPSVGLLKAIDWLKPGGIIHIEVPSSKWFVAKCVNFYYKLIGTNYVTNISPMHAPFHLHEFDLKSFEKICEKHNLEIVYHQYEVCNVYFFPKFLHSILKKYMKMTNKGMQLTVYLRKK